MKTTNMSITFLVGCLFYSIAAWATDLPDYYPPNFRIWGVMDRVDIEHGVAVINDLQMTLSDNIHVYTQNSRFATVHILHPGLKVGIAMSSRGNEPPLVTDLWVLPDDYSQSLR